ncbi:MAG: hypothetical protein V3R80_07085, partial [Candidatus Tectomicrobia bacterium]
YPGETYEDIEKTVDLIRRTLPDDIGVSVSYPLPGTWFFERVKQELHAQTHWSQSNDLAMMFQGTYRSAFYRKLRDVLHLELRVRHGLTAFQDSEHDFQAGERQLNEYWGELEQMERSERNDKPTRIERDRRLTVVAGRRTAARSGADAS